MDELRAALWSLGHPCQVAVGGRRYALPATPLTALGDASFGATHGVRFPYMAGAMADGIAGVELVTALARAGLLGVYGAAGQDLATVDAALSELREALGDQPFGMNLIHSPGEPALEAAVADLYIRRGVRLVEASAYMALTLPVVRYRVHGIHRDASGRVVTPNRLIAKVSRTEVAAQFFAPPPRPILQRLVDSGQLTEAQAALAAEVPMAQDVTAEADSGGHTDNRPLVALLPTLLALRDRLAAQHAYAAPLRVGGAGGIATPAAAAAAFAMGAAYVVTGSVNQACVESGTSPLVRAALAKATQADVAMAPAADMFEMGVKVQVLKHGTMFPMRAAKLYDLYTRFRSLEELPAAELKTLETQVFQAPLGQVWDETKRYFAVRDPRQCARGDADPRHRMALVFRSYLGRSSGWAKAGTAARRFDFQVWCGPAMAAFNEWAKGSALEEPAGRQVVTVALNLLFGAAVLARGNILRAQGAPAEKVPSAWAPLPHADLWPLIEGGAVNGT